VIKKNARVSMHTGTAVRHYLVGEAGKICATAIATAVPKILHMQGSGEEKEKEGEKTQVWRNGEGRKEEGKEEEKDIENDEEIGGDSTMIGVFLQDIDVSALDASFNFNENEKAGVHWIQTPSFLQATEH
jgi:hypothetical protein